MTTNDDPPDKPKLSIVNNLGIENIPRIYMLDLEECYCDERLITSIREYANHLRTYTYLAPGFFFYGIPTSQLKKLYEFVLEVPDQIKHYKAGKTMNELPALHNLMILTYLLARSEGEVDIQDVAFNQLKYTCFAVQLLYLQSIGEAVAHIERYTVLKNERFPECYKPFGELVKPV